MKILEHIEFLSSLERGLSNAITVRRQEGWARSNLKASRITALVEVILAVAPDFSKLPVTSGVETDEGIHQQAKVYLERMNEAGKQYFSLLAGEGYQNYAKTINTLIALFDTFSGFVEQIKLYINNLKVSKLRILNITYTLDETFFQLGNALSSLFYDQVIHLYGMSALSLNDKHRKQLMPVPGDIFNSLPGDDSELIGKEKASSNELKSYKNCLILARDFNKSVSGITYYDHLTDDVNYTSVMKQLHKHVSDMFMLSHLICISNKGDEPALSASEIEPYKVLIASTKVLMSEIARANESLLDVKCEDKALHYNKLKDELDRYCALYNKTILYIKSIKRRKKMIHEITGEDQKTIDYLMTKTGKSSELAVENAALKVGTSENVVFQVKARVLGLTLKKNY